MGNQWRRNLGDLTLVLEKLVNNKENYPTGSLSQKQLADTCKYSKTKHSSQSSSEVAHFKYSIAICS